MVCMWLLKLLISYMGGWYFACVCICSVATYVPLQNHYYIRVTVAGLYQKPLCMCSYKVIVLYEQMYQYQITMVAVQTVVPLLVEL